MGSTNTEQFLPSKGLAIASAFAKGWSDYKKRLQEQEMAKQAQRSELLKVILPRYMEQQQSRAEWERERPLEQSKFQLEQQKVSQTGQLGLGNLMLRLGELEQKWEISKAEIGSAEDEAAKQRTFTIELETIIADLQKATVGMRTGATVEAAKIRAGATTEAATTRAGATKAAAKTRADAAMKRIKFSFGEESKLLKERHGYRIKEIEASKKDERVQTFTKDKIDLLQGMQGTVPKWLEAIAMEPTLVPYYNNIVANMEILTRNINEDITATGGTPIPTSGFSQVEMRDVVEGKDWWWGPIPRIFGSVPGKQERAMPVVPGITPSPGVRPGEAATGLEAQGPPPAMQLPELKTSGPEFEAKLNLMIQQGATKLKPGDRKKLEDMGINPDALEAAAREAQQRK